jgi:tetratricopeptide (TPR) repeat protein
MADKDSDTRRLRRQRLMWITNGASFYPARLHLDFLDVFFRLGRWPQAEEICQRGIAACREMGDEYHRGLFLNQLGNILSYRGLRHQAMAAMEEAHGILSRNPDDVIMISVLYNLGYACEHFGDLDRSLEYYASGQELARRLGQTHSENRASGNIGIIHAMRGDFQTGLQYFHRLLENCEKLGDLAGVALAHGNIGLALLYSGKPAEAEGHLQQKLELSRKMGDRLGICQALGSLGDLLSSRGDYPGALESYARARGHAEAMNNLVLVTAAAEKSGETLILQGRYQEAVEIFLEAISLADKRGTRLSLPSMWQKVGDCHLQLGRPEQAEEAYGRSIALGSEDDQEPFFMGAYRGLARLELDRGEPEKARQHCQRFLELSEKYHDRQYAFEGRVLECLIQRAADPGAAAAALEGLLPQAGSSRNEAEVLCRIWEITGAEADRRKALEAAARALAEAPSAENRNRIARLQGQ